MEEIFNNVREAGGRTQSRYNTTEFVACNRRNTHVSVDYPAKGSVSKDEAVVEVEVTATHNVKGRLETIWRVRLRKLVAKSELSHYRVRGEVVK